MPACAVLLTVLGALGQGQVPSHVNKRSTPATLYELGTMQSSKKRRQKGNLQSARHQTCCHENQRTLTSPLWQSDQAMRLVRGKRLLGGCSVLSPWRSVEVLCSAAALWGISCTFHWKLLVPAAVRQDPGAQQPCCRT